jgi:cell division protein FtsZ
MTDKGIAHIGIGEARGDEKALEAVQQAVSSPLLETTIKGASHVIINISGDISLMDANDAASYVQELTGEEANIIFGAMYDDSVADYARITVIATGLVEEDKPQAYRNNRTTGTFSRRPAAYTSTYSRTPAPEMRAPEPAAPSYTGGYQTQRTPVPSFTMPQMNNTPFTQKTPTSTVEKKDIQIPEFLKNR